MQVIRMGREDAFEVTPLQVAERYSKLQRRAGARVQQSVLQTPPDGRAGRDVYHSRQDSAPRFIVVFVGQLKALRNSSKLLMAPITLQREKRSTCSLSCVKHYRPVSVHFRLSFQALPVIFPRIKPKSSGEPPPFKVNVKTILFHSVLWEASLPETQRKTTAFCGCYVI